MTDLEFFFDPVCPWAWITSRWVVEVANELPIEVVWSPISLIILNESLDYTAFSDSYRAGHETGRNLLRVIEAARQREGEERVLDLYTRFGSDIHDRGEHRRIVAGWREGNADYLGEVGLTDYVDAARDASLDTVLRRSTEEALERTGRDVGTPIITFAPPDGPSFFGPVMSEIPRGERAVELWNSLHSVASFPGMAELKRSKRDRPSFA